jgi:protein phosphatase inhibitor 2
MKRSSSAKPRVRVVWDEENLDFLEASKTPKQKITEPKTPYYAPNTIDGVVSPTPDDEKIPMETALHAEAIRHALSEVASSSKASSSRQSGGGWSSGDDELDDMEQEGTQLLLFSKLPQSFDRAPCANIRE